MKKKFFIIPPSHPLTVSILKIANFHLYVLRQRNGKKWNFLSIILRFIKIISLALLVLFRAIITMMRLKRKFHSAMVKIVVFLCCSSQNEFPLKKKGKVILRFSTFFNNFLQKNGNTVDEKVFLSLNEFFPQAKFYTLLVAFWDFVKNMTSTEGNVF